MKPIKTIYTLELHESLYLEKENINIMKVASGWNYTYYVDKQDENSESYYSEVKHIVFVPYSSSL